MAVISWFDLNFWLFFIFATIFLGLAMHFYIIYTHINYFPTSPFLPVLGHIFDYKDPQTCLISLTNNTVKNGGIIRQFMGPHKPSLVTTNKNFLQFICNNSRYVAKAKYYNYLKPWLGEGLLTSEGDKWMSRRKVFTAALMRTSVLKLFIEVFDKNSNILVGILDNLQNEEFDLHPLIKRFTFDVICETILGVSLNSQLDRTESEYLRSVETLCEIYQARMVSIWKRFDFFYQFSKDFVAEKRSLAVVDRMLDTIIAKKLEEKRKSSSRKENRDLLDLLMEVEIDGNPLSSNDMREEVNSFTFAGYDTSSSAISFALYEIAQNPDIQDKLLKEQKQIFKDDFDNPSVTYEKLHVMSYLEMVIKETLRIHTTVPTVGKRLNRNLIYDGKMLPAMLNINTFLFGFHHNPEYFPDPYKFIPERFAAEKNIDKSTYMPFGVKPRQCIGKNFAMLEMKSVLSKILRNFELTKCPEHQLKIYPKLILHSSTGMRVTVKRRKEISLKQ